MTATGIRGTVILLAPSMVWRYLRWFLCAVCEADRALQQWQFLSGASRWCEHGLWLAGSSGYWAVIFFQQLASIGNNLTIQIVAGQSMKVWPCML